MTRRDGTHKGVNALRWSALGVVRAAELRVGAHKVVGTRAAAIASPAGGSTADPEARAAIAAVLAALRGHGLIET